MGEGGRGSFNEDSLIKKQLETVLRAWNINQHKAKHQAKPYTPIYVLFGAQ